MKNIKNMKDSLVKLLMLLIVSVISVSCSDDEIPEQTLDVNPVTIHGIWKQEEWNGAPFPKELYVYIDFNRKGTFKLYQNVHTMGPLYITGEFSIEKDINLGTILSGRYDFDNGNWNNEYIVTDLLETGSMILTVKNGDEVFKYVRVDSIPSEILGTAN